MYRTIHNIKISYHTKLIRFMNMLYVVSRHILKLSRLLLLDLIFVHPLIRGYIYRYNLVKMSKYFISTMILQMLIFTKVMTHINSKFVDNLRKRVTNNRMYRIRYRNSR